MNKIIIKKSKAEKEQESTLNLRRLNARIQHEDISDEELAHYGVKGMRWGVRKAVDRTGAVYKRSRQLRNRRIISDNELKKSLSRLQMEKQYKQLVQEDLMPGKLATRKLLTQIGTASLMAAAGTIGSKLEKEYLKRKMGG